ncbi:MAG: methionine adenosyltransferase [Bacteroidales bacterium]|nr:methionine adenosyltransferase [Bacteroidales bacterium]
MSNSKSQKITTLSPLNYLFTSESVSEGHPDKVADQISDAILDEFLARDPQSHVACETLVTTGQVVVAGEVTSQAYVDIMDVTRRTIVNIGYNRSALKFDGEACGVLSALHEQSTDINRGVSRATAEEQGAGDQGMMFGYACNETANYMPLSLELSHLLLSELAALRKEKKEMLWVDHRGRERAYLRPDSKSQVTVEYDPDGKPVRVHTIVLSTQHDEFILPGPGLTQEEADKQMRERITRDVREILLPRVKAKLPAHVAALIADDVNLLVNPTGKFVIGGPHGDTGLTGRKIIVDTYGGKAAHGGGAFSGKDPSKVDRSAAYAARHIAKNLVAAGVADEVLVQVAYAIGVAEPVSLFIDTRGTAKVALSDAEISQKVNELFDMRPHAIEERLKLRAPIYQETASYGHMGREPRTVTKHFTSKSEGDLSLEVELFTWEKLDMVESIRQAFSL